MLITADRSCLIVIDVQERLVPAMQAPARVIRNARVLMTAASRLGVPILMTEQYPKGLGHIVPELGDLAKDATVLEKIHFSCMNEPSFAAAFKKLDRRQAVIVGMEAHICVMQTGVNLMEQGYEIFVVTDATSSRTLESEKACLDRLSAAGAGIVTTEMVV
ncbi:MAG: hydrolase, partial [Rhodospirillales bacterium]